MRRGWSARQARGWWSRGLALLTSLTLVAAVALSGLHLLASAPHVTAATRVSLGLALARVTPSVATPDVPVTVQVAVTNSGSTPVTGLELRARLGTSTLGTRRAVREFGAGQGAPATREVATAVLPTAIPAGRSQTVALMIAPEDITAVRAYGVLPLIIEAEADGVTTRQRTYLPVHTRKEYEPMQLAFALPLTLDADPALVTAAGAELDAAWTKLAGPGGRIDRILAGTAGSPVTFALDPTLVGYIDEGSAPASGPRDRPQAPAKSATVTALTSSIAERLRATTTRVWEVPPGDPDLVALAAPGVDHRLLESIASLTTDLPALLGIQQPRGASATIPRIAWPVGEPLVDDARLAVDAAFSARPGGQQAAFVTNSASVDHDPDITGPAARRTPGGSPLLVSDDRLSAALAGTTRGADAGADTQLFLAESLTLLAESPGRARTVLATAPRSFSPDPGALRALLEAARTAPWMTVVPTDTLVTAASSEQAPVAAPRTTSNQASETSQETGTDPGPLSAGVITRLISTGQHIAGISSVLSATDTSGRIPRASTIQALASARWRGHAGTFDATLKAVTDRVDDLTTGVTVMPSTVNFLAEHGILQVTVVNNLDVAVHNVKLVLEPQGRPPRLRVTDPEPLSIAPGSRTTVRVSVDAVAAGVVPVSTYLTTATGTRLGTDATVNVRVQPTGGWVVTVGGVLVGLIFVVGLYRTFRRGRPRVTEADLEGIDLE